MRAWLLWLFLLLVVLADRSFANPYFDDGDSHLSASHVQCYPCSVSNKDKMTSGWHSEDVDDFQADDSSDYTDNALENLMRVAQKRACIRRGGDCYNRRKDCCYSSSCRCNLWGSNCKCQRMGLFQKWG